jgi:hypothetical protein
MERQIRTVIFGIFLTLIISKSHGQCSFLDGKFEDGHNFKKNVRHGLNPQKALEKDDLISFVKIDSIGLTNPRGLLQFGFTTSQMDKWMLNLNFEIRK